MITRYLYAGGGATFMTFSLLYVMQSLIGMQPGVITDRLPGIPVNWIARIDEPEPPKKQETEIDRRKLVESPPLPPRPSEGMTTIPVTMSPPGPPVVPGNPVLRATTLVDGPLVSLYRPSPTYPAIASRRNLEGYVIVVFDVLDTGQVSNVRVVESSDPIFERSAIKATYKARFKPRVVDGLPQSTTGLRNLYRFAMDEED